MTDELHDPGHAALFRDSANGVSEFCRHRVAGLAGYCQGLIGDVRESKLLKRKRGSNAGSPEGTPCWIGSTEPEADSGPMPIVMLAYTDSMNKSTVEVSVATIRKTITLTDRQDAWVKAQIANGDYTNDSEYFRDLVRREQEKFRLLKAAIGEGLASGPSDRTIDEIWASAETRHCGKDG